MVIQTNNCFFNKENDELIASNLNIKKKSSPAPPIIKVFNLHSVSFFNFKLNYLNYQLKVVNKNEMKIITYNIEDYNEILRVLQNENINHFTFTPKKMRPINLLMKGNLRQYGESGVIKALKGLQFKHETTEFLKAFKDKMSGDWDTCSYFVQFKATSNTQEIMNIKRILNTEISWEIVKTNETVQCKRCQRYGHAALNCRMAYRCVKCIDNHLPGHCALKSTNGVIATKDLSCVNCGQRGHSANYRNCAAYQAIIRRRQENIEQMKLKQKRQQLLL